MVDLVRACRSIVNIGREDKALQRCTLSARSMPGDGQEHRLRPVLLPSHPSSGRKATNLLTWGAAPSQPTEWNYPRAVGHMSRLVVCALRRHVESSGESPDRRCSSQPEALGAVQEVTIGLKHSKKRLR